MREPPEAGRRLVARLALAAGALHTLSKMKPIAWNEMWSPQLHPVETMIRATVVFFGVLLLLRLTGRKGLGRSSLWDLAVLFLVGTALRQTLVASDTSLTTGLLSLATLLTWDRLLSHLTFRSRKVSELIEGPVIELIRDGQVQESALKRTLISRAELVSRLREKGHSDLGRVQGAFMEPDGKVTFLMKGGKASP